MLDVRPVALLAEWISFFLMYRKVENPSGQVFYIGDHASESLLGLSCSV
jgi:hypothetical protein